MRKLALALAIVLGLTFVFAGCEEPREPAGERRPPSVTPPPGGPPPGRPGAAEPALPEGGRPEGDVDPSTQIPAEDKAEFEEGSAAK